MTKRSDSEDLRAGARLLTEATLGVTRIVESMHRTIGGGPPLLGRPLAAPVAIAIRPAYATVRGVTRLSGRAVDAILAQLSPLLSERVPGPQRLALLAALNGVLGDYLEETHNPLALGMSLCRDGRALTLERLALRRALPETRRRLLVLVHGSCMSDLQWRRGGHDHGARLEADLPCSAVYLRYNTGLHVSTNGRGLATLLEHLVDAWPEPVEAVTLLGHSMGGLVARSAVAAAGRENLAWRRRLDRVVCLGTPHHGAPLERAGSWVHYLLGISAYSAPLAALGAIRSAGVTDLRHGNLRDEDWAGVDRFHRTGDRRTPLPLPLGVRCYTVAGTKSTQSSARLRGDGLVPVPSALGKHPRPEHTLAFPEAHRLVAFGTDHLGLLESPEVYDTLRRWLSE